MIFPSIEHEAIVQENDRTRLDVSKTYSSKGAPAIVKVEIQPYTGAAQIEVTNAKQSEWYTDYQYDSDGQKVITVTINGATTPVIFTSTIQVISATNDNLFAEDTDLIQEEPDITKFVRKGRNTFKDVHREAQREILDLLDRKGYKRSDGTELTAADAVDKAQVRTMAKYLSLHLIYIGLSNIVDDIFSQKSATYWSKYLTASDRRIIGFDLDGDATISTNEGINTRATRMYKR
jgi:hypothetical protein